MIGLMFFGAIALWGLIAIGLGLWLTKFVRASWSGFAALLFIPLVFFAPVADEIIALPQMKALCEQVNGLELADGMDEKKAYGRTVYTKSSTTSEALWPSSIKVARKKYFYVDATTKEPILQGVMFEPISGMLGVPAGSSGGQMTVLLKKCQPKIEVYDAKGLPTRFSHLNLTKIPSQ
jgi:hypothetical protein